MKVEYFPTKDWYISKRNMELFEDRVQLCHCKVFKCQAFGWLYTGLAKNIKFEILGCLEALEDGCVLVYRYTKERNINECVTTPCMDMQTIGIAQCTGTPGQPP